MLSVVAGLSLKNLHPRVWDISDSHYMPQLAAVMVSYADFRRAAWARRQAAALGLHGFLGVPETVRVYLDNGAFACLPGEGNAHFADYEEFVARAHPDWYPIPRDFIPVPSMTWDQQWECFEETMAVNDLYSHDGYVPVIHVGACIESYVRAVDSSAATRAKPSLALGGMVPNLLRAPKAMDHTRLLAMLAHVRRAFPGKALHVFGVGGTATVHIAALLGVDTADSSGWRNRAARGIVQLPGTGDRVVAELGKWRGRRPSAQEWEKLAQCSCPACQASGLGGLMARGTAGFCSRATHNLWVLLEEAAWVDAALADGTYASRYRERLDNSTYLPLIRELVANGCG